MGATSPTSAPPSLSVSHVNKGNAGRNVPYDVVMVLHATHDNGCECKDAVNGLYEFYRRRGLIGIVRFWLCRTSVLPQCYHVSTFRIAFSRRACDGGRPSRIMCLSPCSLLGLTSKQTSRTATTVIGRYECLSFCRISPDDLSKILTRPCSLVPIRTPPSSANAHSLGNVIRGFPVG